MLKNNYTLIHQDFNYIIDSDYDSVPEGGYCSCDDYCRCTSIENFKVNINSINPKLILDLFIDNKTQYKRDKKINETLEGDISLYGIGRIMAINHIYREDSFEADISGGYYGEELDSITLDETIAKNMTEQIYFFLQMETLKEKIEYLLCLEYDHLLNDLYDKKWKIIEVNIEDIDVPNKQHYKSVPKLDFYDDYNYKDIRCIIRETSTKVGKPYKLTDGYHRLKNTKKKTVKCILAYDGE